MLGQPLDNLLIVVAMIISLPASYSTLCTILMVMSDKLIMDGVIAQILIEEKSQRLTLQTALTASKVGESTGKLQENNA